MAVNAEIFPVGPVRGIVLMVAVFMVDCQQVPVFWAELPAALGADEAVDFQ
jgi:hypothetical protein